MIRYEKNQNIGTITLSHPPVNAIDSEFVAAFHTALDEAEADELTILVIDSDQKCFCAGADLNLIAGFFEDADGARAMQTYVATLHTLFDRVEAFPAVTLAVIAGPALGGGLELALACDMRIASTRAKVGLPEARVGMIPGAGGTQRLPRLVGPGVAAQLILGGEIVVGAEAARLGIVQWATEPGELKVRVSEMSAQIAGLSGQALRASKACIAAYFDSGQDGFARELEVPLVLMATDEARDRVLGFFNRK